MPLPTGRAEVEALGQRIGDLENVSIGPLTSRSVGRAAPALPHLPVENSSGKLASSASFAVRAICFGY